MATKALVTPAIQVLLGQQVVFTAPEELGRASIRNFALAIGDSNPLYADEAYARSTPFGGIVAPPTLVCETWQYLRQPIATEGGILERFGLSIPQAIRGGHEYTFLQPVRPDDIITATWTFAEAYEKQGRSGSLRFLILDIAYTNQRGMALAHNRETLVYRPTLEPRPEGTTANPATFRQRPIVPSAEEPGGSSQSRGRPPTFDEVSVGGAIPALSQSSQG